MVGGGTALLSHLVKAGSRLAINASPEPVTNIAASVTEDFAVLGLVWFAIEHPQGRGRHRRRAPGARAGGPLPGGEADPPRLAAVEGSRPDAKPFALAPG